MTQVQTKNNIQEEKQEGMKVDPGETLREARAAQGLSLDMVHEETKIPLDALRAIEEGYSIRSLSSFYYKGFVKMYAKYLNVDPEKVVGEKKISKIPKHKKIEVEDSDFGVWLSKALTRKRKQQIVIGAGVVLFLFLLIKLVAPLFKGRPGTVKKDVKKNAVSAGVPDNKTDVFGKKSNAVKAVEKERPQVKPRVKPKVKPNVAKPAVPSHQNQQVPVSSTSAGAALPVTPPVTKDVVLTVRAKKGSWLRVKVDGQVVFQSTLRLGAVETWMADSKIEISGKYINQLEFELNGKMIGALGRRGRRIRQIEATKDGFTVIK